MRQTISLPRGVTVDYELTDIYDAIKRLADAADALSDRLRLDQPHPPTAKQHTKLSKLRAFLDSENSPKVGSQAFKFLRQIVHDGGAACVESLVDAGVWRVDESGVPSDHQIDWVRKSVNKILADIGMYVSYDSRTYLFTIE